MDLSAYLADWVTLKPFLQSTTPWDWGAPRPLSAREWGDSSSVLIMERVAQPSSAHVGHAGCASPGHTHTPGPHISGLCWALLIPWQGTQDCKTDCCQNSVWNECRCDTYRQHREHQVLQSLTSEAITMRWDSVLGWGQTLFSAQSSPSPCGIDSTNKDCKLVLHCRKWTRGEKMSCRFNNPAGSFGSCKGVSNEPFSRCPIVREKT